ncbi:MAG: PIN domain nuclease [Salinibacterium sp.]|nr:MAG: PIN domain nuclease [Salinibacterium sp.]
MILVDSSVWIDYFRGNTTPAATTLDALLGAEEIAIGDLVLAEVLQGFGTDANAAQAERLLSSLTLVKLGGRDAAIQAAANFRALRRLGVTVRKTVDTMIATGCIRTGHVLLHNDRDFDAFEQHLGLQVLHPPV